MDNPKAESVLRLAAQSAKSSDSNWVSKIEKFSQLCEDGNCKTHIAFLGTTILARVVEPTADLYAIKPKHSDGNSRAYSARSLCHGVLVPLCTELRISLGVSGREPLNNQPYFRMNFLNDDTPIHAKGRPAFDYMLSLVAELQVAEPPEALEALNAFLAVRSRYFYQHVSADQQSALTIPKFVEAVEKFVSQNSEGGKRAQAVAAGLFDVFAGPDRVTSGRINDPSRKYPGDVCVSSPTGLSWEKAIEVKDKPVSDSDVRIFLAGCLKQKVTEAAILMVSSAQPALDNEGLQNWAAESGIGLTIFYGWQAFIDQVVFWSAIPKLLAIPQAVQFIEQRLSNVEAAQATLELWNALTLNVSP